MAQLSLMPLMWLLLSHSVDAHAACIHWEPSTSSTHSCREPSETGMTCNRKSLRPRPSTHLCQGPPDCCNPKQFCCCCLFVRCWPSVKRQNNQHDDCGRFTGRRRYCKLKSFANNLLGKLHEATPMFWWVHAAYAGGVLLLSVLVADPGTAGF